MEIMELLQQLGRVEPADPEVLDRTADALLVLAGDEERWATAGLNGTSGRVVQLVQGTDTNRGPASRAAGRTGVSRRRWVTRVMAAVLVVGAAAGTDMLLHPRSPAGPGGAAAAVLNHLALVAYDQPATSTPGPGQFLYVSSTEAYTATIAIQTNSFTVLRPENRQIWIAANGSGRIKESFGQPTFLSAHDRNVWEAAGRPTIPHASTEMSFGPGGLANGPTNLANLPTNPTALAAKIASRKIEGGPSGSAEEFTQVGDLLRETDASPALRSALYRVAAKIPGVETLGTVADHSGRRGVGVAYVHSGLRHELIFDPRTSALLGEYYTVVSPGSGYNVPNGTVVGWVVYLQSSIVNALPSGSGTPLSPVMSATSASSDPANQASNSTRATSTTLAP